jgi:hypothetical protein
MYITNFIQDILSQVRTSRDKSNIYLGPQNESVK